MEKWTSVAVRRNRLVLQSAATGIGTASHWRTLTKGRNRQCVCVLKIPLVLLSVIHVVCRVVDKGGLRCADVSLTSSLKRKSPWSKMFVQILTIKKVLVHFWSRLLFVWFFVPVLLLRPVAAALCLWRKKPASLCPRWRRSTGWRRHCPQPSAGRLAWGQRIKHNTSRCKWQLHSSWQWLVEVILVNEYLILMTNSTSALSGDYVSLCSCTSLVKSENDSGPKQLLCGTPHTTVRQTPIKKTKQCLLATKAV